MTENARLISMTPEQREKEELLKIRNKEYKELLRYRLDKEKEISERSKQDRI